MYKTEIENNRATDDLDLTYVVDAIRDIIINTDLYLGDGKTISNMTEVCYLHLKDSLFIFVKIFLDLVSCTQYFGYYGNILTIQMI